MSISCLHMNIPMKKGDEDLNKKSERKKERAIERNE